MGNPGIHGSAVLTTTVRSLLTSTITQCLHMTTPGIQSSIGHDSQDTPDLYPTITQKCLLMPTYLQPYTAVQPDIAHYVSA